MQNNVYNLQNVLIYNFSHRSHFLPIMSQMHVYYISDVYMILMAKAKASYLDLLTSNLLTCYDVCKRI